MNDPEAQARSILLGDRDVPFRLVRARRRTVGLQVGHEGLTVRAPLRLSMREVHQVLHEKSGWIIAKLAEWARRSEHALGANWQDGAPFLYLGLPHVLSLLPAPRAQVSVDARRLIVHLPQPGDAAAVERAIERWLRHQAAAVFAPKLAYFAGLLGLSAPRLIIYGPRTIWGSCNRSGVIRLHWRLLQLPPELSDYILAHEVAHLAEMNHSSRFWAVVGRLYPDFRGARAAVRQFELLLR